MRFISVKDLRGKSAQIWNLLAKEKEIVITSNGKPIAILSATSEETLDDFLAAFRRARAVWAVSSLQRKAAERGLEKPTLREINEEIAKERKRRSN